MDASRPRPVHSSFDFLRMPGKYRVSVKRDGAEPVSKDVEIDGAAVYRVALSLPPKAARIAFLDMEERDVKNF